MKRYSKQQKADAIKLAGEIGVKKASEQLKISVQTIYKWINDAKRTPAVLPEKIDDVASTQTIAYTGSIQELINSDDGALASIEALQKENRRLMNENSNLREANQKLRAALMMFVK